MHRRLKYYGLSVGAIVDEEALGYRVWEGPWIPVSAFAGTGTITRPRLFKAYKNESYK